MKQRPNLIIQAWLFILTGYAALGGATGSALLSPPYRFMLLGMAGLTVILWLGTRRYGRWIWYRTPLDWVILMWLVVLVVTSAANLDSWRRIATGVWFIALYFGLWFIVQDAIANGRLRRETIIETWLFAGFMIIVVGYGQLAFALLTHSRGIGNDLAPILGVARAASSLENPNVLANFLTILIPLGAARLVTAQRTLWRAFWIIYEIAALVLLLLTFGRGGWVSTAVALFAFILLLAVHDGRISFAGVRAWWQTRTGTTRTLLAGGLVIVIIGVVVASGIVLSVRASTIVLRSEIYNAAINLIAEKPITGSGLFTFGKGLLRLGSSPPDEAHNHAHNVLLNIGAELGLFGLTALVVSVFAIIAAIARNWSKLRGVARVQLIGMIAALIGFAIMHQFDVSSISMVIALFGMCVLGAAVAPLAPLPASPPMRQLLMPAFIAGWLIILGLGFWDNFIYQDYLNAIAYGLNTSDFRGAAEQLQRVVREDPGMPVYEYNRGYFLGAAAWKGDTSTLDEAVHAYQRFLTMEPSYAPGWANLSALYRQLQQPDAALDAMRRAVQLTPRSWVMSMNLGFLEEETGHPSEAKAAYRHALALAPDISLLREWDQTSLRRDLIEEVQPRLTRFGQTASLILSDHFEEAAAIWAKMSSAEQAGAPSSLINFLFTLKAGQQAEAEAQLQRMRNSAGQETYESILVKVCEALLARRNADVDGTQKAVGEARALIEPNPLRYADDRVGALVYTQYLRAALPQYLLPQVFNPAADPLTIRLIEALSAP